MSDLKYDTIFALIADVEKAIPLSHDGGMESRIGKIEGRLDGIDKRLDGVDRRLDRVDADFRMTWGMLITGFLGLAGLLAHGFHWL